MQNLAIWMFSLFILSVLVPSIFTTTGGIIQFLLKHFGTVMKFIIVIASFFTLLGITLSWSFFTTKTKIISGIVIALLIMLYTSGKDLKNFSLLVDKDVDICICVFDKFI